MKYTTNLNLKKPDYIDPVDIQDINSNMDTIDSAIQSKADIDTKQDKLTAGDNIDITGDTISAVDTIYNDSGIKADVAKKQDKLTAGANVQINGATNTISATDTITTINGKTGAISKADIVALGIPSQDTNTTYGEITTAEIDAGTASTLRTITGRRIKYILDKVQGWIGGLTKSDVGLSEVDNVKQMPISGGVLENYREKLTTVSGYGGSIDLSLGNVFVHTPLGDRTYSISNAVNGQAHSFTLIINMGGVVRTLTFPASVKWQGGEIPDMSEPVKTYVLTFVSVDGGTTWLGMFGGEF